MTTDDLKEMIATIRAACKDKPIRWSFSIHADDPALLDAVGGDLHQNVNLSDRRRHMWRTEDGVSIHFGRPLNEAETALLCPAEILPLGYKPGGVEPDGKGEDR